MNDGMQFDDAGPDAIDLALASQDRMAKGGDVRRFASLCGGEIVAAEAYIGERLALAKPPIVIGIGMIVAAGFVLRTIVSVGRLLSMSKTAQVILDDAIMNGPDQLSLPFPS